MVMLLEGRYLQFFVHKKLDPPSLFLLRHWNSTYIVGLNAQDVNEHLDPAPVYQHVAVTDVLIIIDHIETRRVNTSWLLISRW